MALAIVSLGLLLSFVTLVVCLRARRRGNVRNEEIGKKAVRTCANVPVAILSILLVITMYVLRARIAKCLLM